MHLMSASILDLRRSLTASLKGESLSSLSQNAWFQDENHLFIILQKAIDLLFGSMNFSQIIKNTSSATAVGLEEWLDTKQLEYHKVLKTNLIIPSYKRRR